MTSESNESVVEALRDRLRWTSDPVSVGRVFGEAYEVDGVTVIPAARVFGGGGGGGGSGEDDDHVDSDDGGFGGGFGVAAWAIGVYEVRDGAVEWKPAVDVNRLAKGGQVLAAIIAICVTLVRLRRR